MKKIIKITFSLFVILTSCNKKNNSSELKKDNKTEYSEINNLKINIEDYKFFSFVDESENLIAENFSDKEFNLLIIFSDNKEEIYGKIKTEDFLPSDVIKNYKNLHLKQLSFKNFNIINNMEGGSVINPKYPCSLILTDIDSQTMTRGKSEERFVKSKNDLIILINSLNKSKISNNTNEKEFKISEGFYDLESKLILSGKSKIKILVLEKNSNRNKEHFANQIILLKNNNNLFYKYLQNNNVIFEYDDNCPSVGFDSVLVKNNYFTIQQMFCSDFNFVHSFTTFKVDEITNEIFLHKYGQKYTDRSNPDRVIPDDVYTIKDFGKVSFEDFNERFVINLIQNRPKK